jgi:hypothetical protein
MQMKGRPVCRELGHHGKLPTLNREGSSCKTLKRALEVSKNERRIMEIMEEFKAEREVRA